MAKIKTKTQLAPAKYDHIDFTPPVDVQQAAKRALEIRATKPPSQKGLTAVGVARARDLSNGRKVSPETARRMLAYFTRHEIDKQSPKWKDWSKGRIAWGAWGGDPGYRWSKKIVGMMKRADERMNNTLRAYSEAIEIELDLDDDRADGLVVGKPFKTLALGQVTSRMSGDQIGADIDLDLLNELVRVYNERSEIDPVVIDWQHATSPFTSGHPAPPESGNALGLIIGLEIKDDGLYAIPAYNERGLEVVQNAGGVLWSSPEFITGEVYSRDGGDLVGNAQLLAITLTPRPAQSHHKIDRITLSERYDMNIDEMSLDELKQAYIAKDELVKELEQKLSDMKDEAESAILAQKVEDDAEKMAESKDEEKMSESKDEEKSYNKMSESLNQSTLLSEVQLLRETNEKLNKRLEKIEAEKAEIEKNDAVKTLLNEGRISPAEQSVVGKAWELRDIQPEFWQMFSERPLNSSVPLETVGHGASGQEISKATLNDRVRELANEKSVSYSEALQLFRKENPDYYAKAFGA